jgi:hypothetical protein
MKPWSRIAIALLFFLTASPHAFASRLYFDFGAGLTQIRGADNFFGNPAPSAMSLGLAMNFGLGLRLTPPESKVSMHIGVQERYNSGGDDSSYYSVAAGYPYLRMEIKRFFMSLGVTVFMFTRVGASAGFDDIKRPANAMAVFAEGGYLWPITPAVSFTASLGTEIMQANSGVYGPKPIVTGLAGLRFYVLGGANFKPPPQSYEDTHEGPYEGWRYPYGRGR